MLEYHPRHQGERWFNVLTHLLGVLFIFIAGFQLWSALLVQNLQHHSVVLYLATFLFVFATSSQYHFATGPSRRKWQLWDHISIYLFILGSNGPYLFVLAGPAGRWVFGLMSAFVLLAIWLKIKSDRSDRFFLMTYLILGWLGLLTLALIWHQVDLRVVLGIVSGGILYTIGTYFYRNDDRLWYHGIWHIFVLLAAISHFVALWWSLLS